VPRKSSSSLPRTAARTALGNFISIKKFTATLAGAGKTVVSLQWLVVAFQLHFLSAKMSCRKCLSKASCHYLSNSLHESRKVN
jgi:hypothetical protein